MLRLRISEQGPSTRSNRVRSIFTHLSKPRATTVAALGRSSNSAISPNTHTSSVVTIPQHYVQKYDHIAYLLRDLHWLQLLERIQFRQTTEDGDPPCNTTFLVVFRSLHPKQDVDPSSHLCIVSTLQTDRQTLGSSIRDAVLVGESHYSRIHTRGLHIGPSHRAGLSADHGYNTRSPQRNRTEQNLYSKLRYSYLYLYSRVKYLYSWVMY